MSLYFEDIEPDVTHELGCYTFTKDVDHRVRTGIRSAGVPS